MRRFHALPRFAAPALLLSVCFSGCQKAERYETQPGDAPARRPAAASDKSPPSASAEALNPEIQWIEIDNPPKTGTLIEFVHAGKSPEEWAKLPQFWNAPALTEPAKAAALLGLSPLAAISVAGGSASAIKIKVPLGLPETIPNLDSPLTLSQWQLGKRLFFDKTWLKDKAGTSCAGCHQPDHGFADRESVHPDSTNTPTLINCAFNTAQFWDGRVTRLEEVVQRTLEDERETSASKPFRHTWSGVIRRLRNMPPYHMQFNKVFGTPPREVDGKEQANITQDTVGRALAAYLRTILAGDSIHDRAQRVQAQKHSPILKAEHYEAVLDDAALKELSREKVKKADVAAELIRGYLLFTNRDETRPLIHCSRCHSGENFTDNGFHNLGIGFSSGERGGRFALAPIGTKDSTLIDAYKTPTLRNLLRTGPYFHTGEKSRLRDVVEFYNLGAESNSHLDRRLRGKDGGTRLLRLSAAEIDAVVLFLSALNGGEVDAVVKSER